MEKSRDIAILKTMGGRARKALGLRIFMLQGLVIGLIGTAAGRSLGYLAWPSCSTGYQVIKVPIDVYQISHLPFIVLPLDYRGRRISLSSFVSSPRYARPDRPRGWIPCRRCDSSRAKG